MFAVSLSRTVPDSLSIILSLSFCLTIEYSVNLWHHQPFRSLISLWNEFYASWLFGDETIGINTEMAQQKLHKLLLDRYGSDSRKIRRRKFLQNEKWMNIQRRNNIQTPAPDIPFVIVRFEDILFSPKALVQRLCRCVGGVSRNENEIIVHEQRLKSHGHSRDRQQALSVYGDPLYRYELYTESDLAFLKQELDPRIIQMFGYNM